MSKSPKKSVTLKSPIKTKPAQPAPVPRASRSKSAPKQLSPKKSSKSPVKSLKKAITVTPNRQSVSKSKKMVTSVAKRPQRSVTIDKRKESPKKTLKPKPSSSNTKMSTSKSPDKTQMRKRDQKAARKDAAKMANLKRSASVMPRSRSKSLS